MNTTLRTLTAAAAAVGILALAACGSESTDTSSTSAPATSIPHAQQWDPTDLPDGDDPSADAPTPANALPEWAADVDRTDAFQVAKTAAQVWYSWDPVNDSGPDDAAARTAPLLTPGFATSTTSTGSVAGPGAQWASWSAARASVKVTVTPAPTDGAPTNDPSTKYFIFRVTQTPYTPAGAVLDTPDPKVVAVIATASGLDQWEVSSLTER